MKSTRKEDKSGNEEYCFYLVRSSRNSGFFKSSSDDETKLLNEKDPEEKARLDSASSSCIQFKLTMEEQAQIEECDKSLQDIHDKTNELGKLQFATLDKKKNIRFCEDPELKSLISERINKKYPRHAVDCRIDKVERIVEVTIKDCEDKDAVRHLFQPLLKTMPKIERDGRAESIEDHLRIVVSFNLRDRDNLIAGLKLSNEVYSLPEARKYFQGC